MRIEHTFNNNWQFSEDISDEDQLLFPNDEFIDVNLPHNAVDIPYNYFDEKIFQKVVCYSKAFSIEDKYRDKLIFIDFEAVMSYAKVYINGQFAGEHKGGFTAFSVRIDQLYDWNSPENRITVIADSNEIKDIPPYGGQIDYLTYSGIYRDVSLRICDPVHIKNIKIEHSDAVASSHIITGHININNFINEAVKANVTFSIYDRNGSNICREHFSCNVSSGEKAYSFSSSNIESLKLWDIDNPQLYKAELSVAVPESGFEDSCSASFGIRDACFKSDGFYLNNKKMKLMGLNRHQSFPYVGYAMPKRVQEKDADILKYELGLNIVRTSHYPQSKHFLSRCDEIGLLVFEEIPGWQHIGGEEWQKTLKVNVREMIEHDWNHPSIIMWGVRVNESEDNDALYKETNDLARSLDKTRQTGGVRCIKDSNLLEDVYTYNDFNLSGDNDALLKQMSVTGLDYEVPYIVTEYNGHMFPTKKFDQEERVSEHVLRHLKVLNAMFGDDNISGSIGWCAFDYNTHKDFGSGDKICYHGVMDMFRFSKFAAYSYASQNTSFNDLILEPVTYWTRGERSIGGVFPLVILSNCKFLDVYVGENRILEKLKPAKDVFPFLPNPPFILTDEIVDSGDYGTWGMGWQDGTIIGYDENGNSVKKKLAAEQIPSFFDISIDDDVLNSKQKDATRVTVQIKDQYMNKLWFLNEILFIDIEGPANLIGPDQIITLCGEAAFWIETKNIEGVVNIKVSSARFGEKKVSVNIRDLD